MMGTGVFKTFLQFSAALKRELAVLSTHTPYNRELAFRLVKCLVENRIQGTSNQCNIAEVLATDVEKANQHMLRWKQSNGQNPRSTGLCLARRNMITQRGQGVNDILLPYSTPDADRCDLDATQLEDLLNYQHVLADDFQAQARTQQLTYNYQ
jgi:hypothetical protein